MIFFMEKDESKLVKVLVEKSKEAAYMAVEIMNKPTIHYRTEGFCFFICNAWELLLKAFLVDSKGPEQIYVPSKDGAQRTKGLSDCMGEVFTSTDNPVRANLSIIVRMRNRATYMVSSADDKKYAPGFQQCVSNYFAFLRKHFSDLAKTEMTPFISLAVGDPQANDTVLVDPAIEDFFAADNSCFEPLIRGKLILTKRDSDADFKAFITKDGDYGVIKVDVPKDLGKTHPFTQSTAVKRIKEMLSANGVDGKLFNSYSFGKIKKDLKFVDDQSLCYEDRHYTDPRFYYSQKAIDLIVSKFLEDEAFRDKYRAREK